MCTRERNEEQGKRRCGERELLGEEREKRTSLAMQKKFYAQEKFHHVREMVEEKEDGEGRERGERERGMERKKISRGEEEMKNKKQRIPST